MNRDCRVHNHSAYIVDDPDLGDTIGPSTTASAKPARRDNPSRSSAVLLQFSCSSPAVLLQWSVYGSCAPGRLACRPLTPVGEVRVSSGELCVVSFSCPVGHGTLSAGRYAGGRASSPERPGPPAATQGAPDGSSPSPTLASQRRVARAVRQPGHAHRGE